jgi:uncharacterized protein
VAQQWQDERVMKDLVRATRTIAVVGLSPRKHRDSLRVARYLQRQGYRIIPVNPNADEVLGEKSYPSLQEVPEQIDLVDVFRRPEFVADVARDAVEIGAKAIWMQIGVVNEEAARIASEAGLKVVMDRCLMVEHWRLTKETG